MDGEFKEFFGLCVKSIDTEKRQIRAVASAGTIDRDGEIILPTAFKDTLPIYMQNPVILTSHQQRLNGGESPVVGKVFDAQITKGGLEVGIEFAKTPLADQYWHLYSEKFQRALSIGFIPMEHEVQNIKGKSVSVHTKVELLEISCVAVPSCREALSRSAQGRQRFVGDKQLEKQLRDEGVLSETRSMEFAEMLLDGKGIDGDGLGEFIGDEEQVEIDFVKIVNNEVEKDASDFAAMFA